MYYFAYLCRCRSEANENESCYSYTNILELAEPQMPHVLNFKFAYVTSEFKILII
jgi:hypothetical protein